MHAKRTRDRKKQLLEVSESMISEMENESHSLREYLVSLKLISVEEAEKSEERANESKKELAALKVNTLFKLQDSFMTPFFLWNPNIWFQQYFLLLQASQNEYDLDGDDDDDDDHFNDDNGDGDDEHDNDGSLSGSDDNEKGSWSGSNNGNDSINGDTSGDGTASTGSNNSSSHNAPSSSSSSRSHNSSGSGSGSGGDSPTPKHVDMEWSKEQETSRLFNYGTKPSGSFKPSIAVSTQPLVHVNGVVYAPRAAGAKKSQSVESYNHGGVVPVNEEAKAVEKATYLVYSLHAQDKLLQASSSSSVSFATIAPAPPSHLSVSESSISISMSQVDVPVQSVQEMNATLALAAADYYQGQIQLEPRPSQGWLYPPSRTVLASVPISPAQISFKVPNILLSIIPQGILAPQSQGGVSPRGTFSPIELSLTKPFATPTQSPTSRITTCGSAFSAVLINNSKAQSGFVDINQFPVFQKDSIQHRNLPSSNYANGNAPL